MLGIEDDILLTLTAFSARCDLPFYAVFPFPCCGRQEELLTEEHILRCEVCDPLQGEHDAGNDANEDDFG